MNEHPCVQPLPIHIDSFPNIMKPVSIIRITNLRYLSTRIGTPLHFLSVPTSHEQTGLQPAACSPQHHQKRNTKGKKKRASSPLLHHEMAPKCCAYMFRAESVQIIMWSGAQSEPLKKKKAIRFGHSERALHLIC